MNRYRRYLLLMIPAFLLVVTPIYAITSGDFLTKTNKYVNKTCEKKHVSKRNSLLCFLFYKSSEQDTRITNLENQSTDGKVLKIIIQGQEFGPVTDQFDYVLFSEQYQRFVRLMNFDSPNYTLGENITRYFETTDCTGTSYLNYNSDLSYLNIYYNNVLNAGFNLHFIADRNSSPTSITRKSLSNFNYGTGTLNCFVSSGSQTVIPLTEVSLPVTEPITTPFEFVYD